MAEPPLERMYTMVMLDAIHYNVREEGTVMKNRHWHRSGKEKDVLVLWVGATESLKYWLGVLNGLKNRGVQDILVVSVDGLTGFSEAIPWLIKKTENQRCIIHQIRSSTRYVPTHQGMLRFMP